VIQGHHESNRTVRIPNRVRTSNYSSCHESNVCGSPVDPTADLRTHYGKSSLFWPRRQHEP